MSNLNELKPVGNLSPFARFCCTIGNLPSSYMVSLTYEEQLLWLCDYLKNTVIPAVNTNAEAVKELQELYIKLKDYVDHYFENLDVQNEINIKLDEMAEDGTLDKIINQDIFGQLNSDITNLKNENIIIKNNLTFITPEMFGCIGDGITDDSINFQECINKAIELKCPIFAFKSYLITKTLKINSNNLFIFGNKSNRLVTSSEQNNIYSFIFNGEGYLFDSDDEFDCCIFQNLSFNASQNNSLFNIKGYRNKFLYCNFYNADKSLFFGGIAETWRGENEIIGCFFDSCNYSIYIDSNNYADSYIRNCTFISGEYAIYGSFNAWCLDSSHDYSNHGINVNHFANSQLINNYFDHHNFPFIKISLDFKGGSLIANNKFLIGTTENIENSIIEINNNIFHSLTISNNTGSGAYYTNLSFINFTGNNNITLSLSGNSLYNILPKILKNYPKSAIGSMTNYAGYDSCKNVSGNVNLNFCFFNNGLATIMLDVSNAGLTLCDLPFKSPISMNIPVYDMTNNVWGVGLINVSNNKITIPSNFTSHRILINCSYLVFAEGNGF